MVQFDERSVIVYSNCNHSDNKNIAISNTVESSGATLNLNHSLNP